MKTGAQAFAQLWLRAGHMCRDATSEDIARYFYAAGRREARNELKRQRTAEGKKRLTHRE